MELSFEQMVQEILARTNISRDELMARMRKKEEELGGLVTHEGLAMIVGRELGVEFIREELEIKELKIEDLIPGMSNINLLARVVRIHEPKTFQRQSGSVGKMVSLVLQDQTGQIRAVLWDDKVELVEEGKIQKGNVVQIHGAYVRQGLNQQPEINIGSRGSVAVNPDDVRARSLPQVSETKLKIADLKPELGEVDILGRVATVSDVKAFERTDGSLGKVVTVVLVDDTGQTRVSFWDDKAELARDLKRGDVVKLENASVRVGLLGRPELRLGAGARLLLNPSSLEVSQLPKVVERLLKIGELEADMLAVGLAARVRRKFTQQEFRRDDGTIGRVASLVLEDETGFTRASFWDGMSETAQKLRIGDIVLVHNAYTRAGITGKPEVHVGRVAWVQVNPPGIAIEELKPSRIKIGELEPGMDALEVVCRVMEVSALKSFTRADGSAGKVATITIGDQTGSTRVSLWQEHADKAARLEVGDIVALKNTYTTVGFYGQAELQLDKLGQFEVNPTIHEKIPPVDVLLRASTTVEPKTIDELQKPNMRAQVRGTIVRVFQRRPIFDVCPNCGRSLGSVDTSLLCEECGKVVSPEHRVVLSFVVDDGTGSIRAVLFGKMAEELIGKSSQQVFEMFKQARDLTEFYQNLDLEGREVILAGITRQDKYYDQLELRVTEVRWPDAKEEAGLLLEKIKEM